MIDLLLPMSIATGLLTWILIARWYVLPWLRDQTPEAALTPLLLLNAFRYVGLAFLIPGVTAEALDPRFANPAAWGDFAAAIFALIALLALKQGWKSANGIIWAFNVFGALDLVNAITQGLRYTIDGHLGSTYFIPALIVPALLVAHGLIAIIQIKGTNRQKKRTQKPADQAARAKRGPVLYADG